MDWKQPLPRYGEARKEILQATVDEIAKFSVLANAAISMGIPVETLNSRLKAAARQGITSKYLAKKSEKSELPKGIRTDRTTKKIISCQKTLILNDIHVPYHDENALMIALEYGLKSECDGVLVNGDFMDCSALSKHEKTPSEREDFYGVELPVAGKILSAMNKMFPNAKKYLNEGNHEYMFPRYLARNSQELYRRDGLVRELKPEIYGFEFVYRETPITIGRLHVRHGDEFRGGGAMNVARTKYLQASGNIIFGRHHRTQQYTHKTIAGKHEGSWAVGCLCDLSPSYILENQWNLGFAIVTLHEDGGFAVDNKMILNGKIY